MVGFFYRADLFDLDIEVPGEAGQIPARIITLSLGNQNGPISLASRRADLVWNASHRADRAIPGDWPVMATPRRIWSPLSSAANPTVMTPPALVPSVPVEA